ncbi:MAG: VWA domain-containing protein [candidate division Zixibacteria bacterium]|nr:VWA domain-containing protein [candidate division Zixibacteria bacterium]
MFLRFADPWFLTAGLIVAVLAWWMIRTRGRRGAVAFSHLPLIGDAPPTWRVRFRWLPSAARMTALTALALAIARPQTGTASREVTSEGIDIVLALDVSGSMKAEDFQPHNRLYVAKQTIREFIQGRTNDRIGLVVFAGESFTQCPLTTDYSVLISFLDKIDFGIVEDGTAIGVGLANAVNRLRESHAKSKIVILLTDGVNNRGQIEPLTAAEIAKTLGIKVYTIGAGKPGNAMYPVEDPVFGKRYVSLPNEIDEQLLQQMADMTGGRYYRAQSAQMLERIYKEISTLEKTEVKVKEYVQYRELFGYLGALALALTVVGVGLDGTWFRTLP